MDRSDSRILLYLPSPGPPAPLAVSFILENWYLIVAAALSAGLLAWPLIGRGAGAHRVTAADAVTLINRERAVMIDVSEPAEFAAGHAAGARNIPLGSLETGKGLPSNKALPLVVICPSGARSTKAVAVLHKLGHERASSLIGGLAAWREAQLPVEKTALQGKSAT